MAKKEKDVEANENTDANEMQTQALTKQEPPNKQLETKEIKKDALIKLRSVVGNLTYIAKKGYPEFHWKEKGEVQEVLFSEFLEMRGQQSRFFEEPWLIIENNAVLDKFPIYKDLYTKFASIKSLDWLESGNVETVKLNLSKIPDTMLPQLSKRATGLIASGKIDNIKVIKLLEEKLNQKLLNLIL